MRRDGQPVYGLLAGKGELPCRLIAYFKAHQIPFYGVGFENQTPPETLEGVPCTWVKLGTVAPLLSFLKKHQVTHLIMAGGIKRPSLSELSLDWAGTRLLARIGLKSLGDDGVLSAIVSILEEEGFEVVAADSILNDLRVQEGILSHVVPTEEDLQDIKRGVEILTLLAPADVGQAVVVQQGIVLGIEAIEGTSHLIERVGPYKRQGSGGVLVKMSKKGQNLKVDLPTIGPDTMTQLAKAGLAGVAIEAGKSQIVSFQETKMLADKLGLFIYGLKVFEVAKP